MTPFILQPQFAIWSLGTLGIIDLIAATTNAFNGALLARRPDHYKHFTLIGVILLAYIGGIGGGILRDVLVNIVPSPLINPWYIIFCTAAAALALVIEFYSGQAFRSGLFAFATAFSLPWYAIIGAQTAVDHHIGLFAAVLIAVIATTGGRFIIDIACGVVPKQLVRGEFFVLTAVLTATLYLTLRYFFHVDVWISTAIAAMFGFGFRLLCQFMGWEEWEPWEPPQAQAGEKARHGLSEDLQAEFGDRS
ncbi:MAG: TRIC cation channel family protein [Candidatus Eremiobacteraeota bacterium]|nr:TRIC cation channel family protein [Candidatus Eremiobacteraeota bacterium]